MDEDLDKAERQARAGEVTIARQKKIVTQLEATGRETSDAKQILDDAEASQKLHLADVHRMERVLDKPTSEAATGGTDQSSDRTGSGSENSQTKRP